MTQEVVLKTNNSTNVRPAKFSPLCGCFWLMAQVSPKLTSRVAAHLFTHPHGSRQRSVREESWLRDAIPFELEYDGRKLAAWSWGDGPTVLLHHGWNGRGSQLGAFVAPLLEAGFSVVTYDAPAHGQSPGRFTNGLELSRIITQVSRQMHGLHAIVSHSLGCLATAYALRHPLPVGRIVFLSPPADMLTYTQLFVDKAGLGQQVHDLMLDHFERTLDMDWAEFNAERLAQADRGARGKQTPLLVVHDRHDRQVPWQHGQRYHQAWEGSRFHQTKRLGHQRILRDEEVAREVVEFLAGEV